GAGGGACRLGRPAGRLLGHGGRGRRGQGGRNRGGRRRQRRGRGRARRGLGRGRRRQEGRGAVRALEADGAALADGGARDDDAGKAGEVALQALGEVEAQALQRRAFEARLLVQQA